MAPTRTLRAAAALSFALAAVSLGGPALAEPKKDVLDLAETYKKPALELLEKLVNIDSGSGDEEGLGKVGDMAIEQLRSVGAEIQTVSAKAPGKADNIVGTVLGRGKGRILLIAHMDTVFKQGDAAKRPFKIDGARAYGPGVMDDKGGIVMGVFALKMLKDLHFNDFRDITLVLNSSEEIGSPGARDLIADRAKESDVVINLEPGRAADGLVVSRKGAANIDVEVKGRTAHAGAAPEKGRNAALELAHQVTELTKLADKDKGTTVNFTVLKAGTSSNIIPDEAQATADVRAETAEEFDRVERDLAAAKDKTVVPDTTVTAKLERHFPPMTKNPKTDGLAEKAQAIYGELGKTLTLESSGGAADSSIAAGAGAAAIDGFGIVGGELHTDREYAEVESVAPRLYLLTRLIMELGPQGKELEKDPEPMPMPAPQKP